MTIQATDIFIYLIRDGVDPDYSPVACAQNGQLDVVNTFINTASKGTGKVGGLMQAGYNGSLSCSGVVDTDKLTGLNILPTALNGQSVQIYFFSSSNFAIFFLAKIENISFGFTTGNLLKFSATFKIESEIVYEAQNIYISTYPISSANQYLRVSTTTESLFTDTPYLAGKDYTRLVVSKNGIVLPVMYLSNTSDPVTAGYVGYVPSGSLKFNPSLIAGDKIIVFY